MSGGEGNAGSIADSAEHEVAELAAFFTPSAGVPAVAGVDHGVGLDQPVLGGDVPNV